jgi:HlyD family secretion protein
VPISTPRASPSTRRKRTWPPARRASSRRWRRWNQAKAAVDQSAVNASHTIIRSPVDGIVIERAVDVGQTLAATVQSPTLFRIAGNLDRLQVQVDVDESDVGGLIPGEPVTFDVDAYPGERFHGTISQVRVQPVAQQTATATAVGGGTTQSPATSTVATVVSYTTIVDVANLDQRLRPGMTADVVLPVARASMPSGSRTARWRSARRRTFWRRLVRSSRRRRLGGGTVRAVWEYDGRQFTPIAVRAGVADEGWTELVSGSIRPGDELVTGAVLQHRHRL